MTQLENIALGGKRVFLRLDLNTPLDQQGGVADDYRIRAALPTLQYLRKNECRIVIGSHLGRPKGTPDAKFSLEPVAAKLAELLRDEIRLTDEPVGDGATKVVRDLREGQVVLLENLRFHPGETRNDEGFAKELAAFADVYVNDAFGTCHRAHASTAGMVPHVQESCAGLLVSAEIEKLSRLQGETEPPYVAVVGGSKVSDKVQVLDALLPKIDVLLIGGAMANTFLAGKGISVGNSKIEEDKLPLTRDLMRRALEANVIVHLPKDVIVTDSFESDDCQSVAIEDIGERMALDIGPATRQLFRNEIKGGRTLFWNGPMGVFERPTYAEGTFSIAKAFAENQLGYTVIGGGDSALAARVAQVSDKIDHVSTGGGAALEFIQGMKLPGLVALGLQ